MKKIIGAFLVVLTAMLLRVPISQVLAETTDYCAGLTGAARGLCIAATHGANCQEAEPSATKKACDRLATKFRDVTRGQEPPWITNCPCPMDETINQLFAGYTDDLVCAMNPNEIAIHPEILGSTRYFEASKQWLGSYFCQVYKDGSLVGRIYIDDEAVVDDCIEDAKRIAATYVGTPVETVVNGGVCWEL